MRPEAGQPFNQPPGDALDAQERTEPALQYLAQAQTQASALPGALRMEPRLVETVAIIGAGTMGAGIAICAIDAGLKVILLEQNNAAMERGRERVSGHYQGRVVKGKLSSEAAAAGLALLSHSTDWTLDGVAQVIDFRGDVIRFMTSHGWLFFGENIINKDPRPIAVRTKAQNLLH